MKTDQYGQVTISEKEAVQALYQGLPISNMVLDQDHLTQQFNNSIELNRDRISKLKSHEDLTDISLELFDESNQCDWFMPEDYCPNLVEMLYGMCETEVQIHRVNQELELFIQHGMFDLLFYLKYLVDTMRENNIVWGVGRGSSVASYVLFLIGVHRIDSIKYNLDIDEFLREK